MKIVFESSTAIVTYLDNGHLLHTDRTSVLGAPGRISRARSVPIGSYRAVRGSLSAAKNEPPIGIKIKNSAAPAATRLIKG